MGSSDGRVSWVDPDYRGTSSIIWSCILVIFTAVYTVLHLNLPAPKDNWFKILFRRSRWVALSVLAPDMLTLTAASQWDAARKSVAAMHAIGYREWTMVHAFYANSGGFFIHSEDMEPFPVMATTIHFLLSRGYIDKPSIARAEIWDKSKSDKFAKGAALIQSGWLVIASIGRVAQGLPLAPAEVFTLAFIVSTFMSYYFWLHKPQQVGTPTYLKLDCRISDIIAKTTEDYPAAITPYQRTPFDFIEVKLQRWQRREIVARFDLYDKPVLRVPDDAMLPDMWRPTLYALVGIPSLVHSTIHVLVWNDQFPTKAEQLLWRGASITLLAASSISVSLVSSLMRRGYKGRLSLTWIWVNSAPRPDPEKATAWHQFRFRILDVVVTIASAALILARLCIIAEAIISFRSLPKEVYQTIRWSAEIPHFG